MRCDITLLCVSRVCVLLCLYSLALLTDVSNCLPLVDEYSILSIPTQADSPLAKLVLTDIHLDATDTTPLRSKDKTGPRLDCESQRKKSQIKRVGGDNLVYVPTCNSKNNSLYLAVQCHDTTKYCWCVHVVSGEPIPGSTTLVDRPRCVEEKPPPKKEKARKNRCSGQRRARFLRRLVSSLKTEMIMAGNDSRSKVGKDAAVQWKFTQLDKNKNKVLERSEWRGYKSVLLQWRRARHCSRSLFKSCDTDGNKKLSQTEWKQCIGQDVNRVPAKRPEQLNPFLYILKPE